MSFWKSLLVKLGLASVEALEAPGTLKDKKAAVVGAIAVAGVEAVKHGLEKIAEEDVPSTPKTPEEKAAAQAAKEAKKAAKSTKT